MTKTSDDSEVRFCCHGFQALAENPGRPGVSILARIGDRERFILQSRGVDIGLEPRALECDFKINIISEFVVCYCPFCGEELRSWISSNRELFDVLAKKHESLLLSRG